MNKTKLDKFFDQFPEIIYEKGEKILRPNEYSEHVYCFTGGYIRVYKVLKSGQEITYNFYNPSKQKKIIFGFTPVISEIHIDAYSDVVLRRGPAKQFKKFLQENPEVYVEIMQEFVIFFSELVKHVEWLSVPDANTRLKLVLHSFAMKNQALRKQRKEEAKVEMKLTHHLLASYTGLTRETITIQLKNLMKQGYIMRNEGSIIIKNPDKLIADI